MTTRYLILVLASAFLIGAFAVLVNLPHSTDYDGAAYEQACTAKGGVVIQQIYTYRHYCVNIIMESK